MAYLFVYCLALFLFFSIAKLGYGLNNPTNAYQPLSPSLVQLLSPNYKACEAPNADHITAYGFFYHLLKLSNILRRPSIAMILN